MGEAKRRTYTAAFKAKVGLEAIRGVKTVNEICQEHGIHPAQVGQWKREIQEQAETLLKESYFDALNNEHNYFEVVDGSSADKAGARKGVRRQRAEA